MKIECLDYTFTIALSRSELLDLAEIRSRAESRDKTILLIDDTENHSLLFLLEMLLNTGAITYNPKLNMCRIKDEVVE